LSPGTLSVTSDWVGAYGEKDHQLEKSFTCLKFVR